MGNNAIYKGFSLYSVINILYLMILLFISLFANIYPDMLFPKALSFLPASLIIYLLAQLTYCHIVYHSVYLFVCLKKFIHEKSLPKALFTVLISLSGIFLNLYWIPNGKPFLVN